LKKQESKLQSECYIWYNNNYCLKNNEKRGLMFAVPNELGTNNALTTMLSKATGLLSGVADTVVILPTKDLIFVEFKTDVGRQSKAQKEFEKRVTDLAYKYFVIRSLSEFKELIITLLKNTT
jgi:hypothetical protein